MYPGLAASLGYGAASEIIRRTGSGSQDRSSSVMMTEANIKRLVMKLSQMRGAALKLGQFMSIQGMSLPYTLALLFLCFFFNSNAAHFLYIDTHVLPAEIDKIFRRVQDSAHYMPDWQMEVRTFFFLLFFNADHTFLFTDFKVFFFPTSSKY